VAGTDTRTVGDAAEDLALRYLVDRGLRPVTRNYRCRFGEIDLVMRDGACMVFVEVRLRCDRSYADAALTVDRRKQRKIANTASMFLARQRLAVLPTVRFDVVGIDRAANGRSAVQWIRDAFRPA